MRKPNVEISMIFINIYSFYFSSKKVSSSSSIHPFWNYWKQTTKSAIANRSRLTYKNGTNLFSNKYKKTEKERLDICLISSRVIARLVCVVRAHVHTWSILDRKKERQLQMKSASTESLKNFPIVVSLLVFVDFHRRLDIFIDLLIQFRGIALCFSYTFESGFESVKTHAFSSLQTGKCQTARREWLCRSQYGVGVVQMA